MAPTTRSAGAGGVLHAALHLLPRILTLLLAISGLLLWKTNAGPARAALTAAVGGSLTAPAQVARVDALLGAAHTAALAVLGSAVALAGVSALAGVAWRVSAGGSGAFMCCAAACCAGCLLWGVEQGPKGDSGRSSTNVCACVARPRRRSFLIGRPEGIRQRHLVLPYPPTYLPSHPLQAAPGAPRCRRAWRSPAPPPRSRGCCSRRSRRCSRFMARCSSRRPSRRPRCRRPAASTAVRAAARGRRSPRRSRPSSTRSPATRARRSPRRRQR